jgi:ubiquinone/menaquinone biosynthesis C-methylase UbiE
LPDRSADWLTMASSFHWVDRTRGLKEFYRVLKPGGYFTALWNPRDLQKSEFHMGIEAMIQSIVPGLKRISSGSTQCTETFSRDILSAGHFKDVIFMEAEHEVMMTPERYIGAWQSVNDIQAQAGPECWKKIIHEIKHEIRGMKEIVVPYKTRAWTVQKV